MGEKDLGCWEITEVAMFALKSAKDWVTLVSTGADTLQHQTLRRGTPTNALGKLIKAYGKLYRGLWEMCNKPTRNRKNTLEKYINKLKIV